MHRVGCYNQNTATKSFLVRYDEQGHVVTVNVGEFAHKPLPKEKLEQVPLTVGITDNCDPHPLLTVTGTFSTWASKDGSASKTIFMCPPSPHTHLKRPPLQSSPTSKA